MIKLFTVCVLLSFIPVLRINAKYCQSIAPVCDCAYIHHDIFWSSHNIHCPKQVNGSAYNFTVKLVDTVSVTIECYNHSSLTKLSVLNLNAHVYKVEFKNCFNNDTNLENYKFELNDFLVRQLNVKFFKTLNIAFSDYGKVDEKYFFNNWNPAVIWQLKIENVHFKSSEVLQNCRFLRVVNFTNTNIVNFSVFNNNLDCSGLKIFIIRDTKIVQNLNRQNVAKIKSLQELKIFNSCILNYSTQMFHDGAIFAETLLKFLTLQSTFNCYDVGSNSLNETLLNGINLVSLVLIDLKLTELPPKIFLSSTLLRILNLSNNLLRVLDPDLFKNCNSLKKIDLSFNNFVRFEDTTIFSNIAALIELRISYNKLESFKFGTISHNFTNLLLDHNYIKTEGDKCPIMGVHNREGTLDLSYNQISKSRPIIDCLNSNQELKLLDVSNNQMIDIIFEDALPYGRPALFNTKFNLENNKISFLPIFNTKDVRISFPQNILNVHLDSNPAVCNDCRGIKKMFNNTVFHYSINRTLISIHPPKACLSSTLCLMSKLDGSFKCPMPCDCLYDGYKKKMLIDCENNNLTVIPHLNADDMFKLNFTELDLILQYNRIKNIEFPNISTALLDKLYTLNLENNDIETLKFHPMEFPKNIKLLQLAGNRISQVDMTTMALLNARNFSLSVTLFNNSIATNSSLFKILSIQKKFKIIDMKEIEEQLQNIESANFNESQSITTNGTSGFLIVALVLLTLAGGALIMYTIYHRLGSINIFKRLREQNNSSELMLGIYQDE